jgi:hypothetical protein
MRTVWIERLERRWSFPTEPPLRAPDLSTAAAIVVSG